MDSTLILDKLMKRDKNMALEDSVVYPERFLKVAFLKTFSMDTEGS